MSKDVDICPECGNVIRIPYRVFSYGLMDWEIWCRDCAVGDYIRVMS